MLLHKKAGAHKHMFCTATFKTHIFNRLPWIPLTLPCHLKTHFQRDKSISPKYESDKKMKSYLQHLLEDLERGRLGTRNLQICDMLTLTMMATDWRKATFFPLFSDYIKSAPYLSRAVCYLQQLIFLFFFLKLWEYLYNDQQWQKQQSVPKHF